VRCALVLFGFALMACARPAPPKARPPNARAPTRGVASAAVPSPSPPDASCRATPSTVYGSEPVVFALEASAPGRAGVTLVDERGQTVISAMTPVPGTWRAPELPSGDFSLRIGPNHPACWVTVNREQSRATQPAR
jgi:hypothetical protein